MGADFSSAVHPSIVEDEGGLRALEEISRIEREESPRRRTRYAPGDSPMHVLARAGSASPSQYDALSAHYSLMRNGRGMYPLHVLCANAVGGLSRPALLQVLSAMQCTSAHTAASRRAALAAISFGARVARSGEADALGRTPLHLICANPALGVVSAEQAEEDAARGLRTSLSARFQRAAAALLRPARVVELVLRCSAVQGGSDSALAADLTAGGRSALHLSCSNASLHGDAAVRIASSLIARHADIAALVDERGRYALHCAAARVQCPGWSDAVEFIAAASPAKSLGARDVMSGATPAHVWARAVRDTASAAALLRCWARLGGLRGGAANGALSATSGAESNSVARNVWLAPALDFGVSGASVQRRIAQARRLREVIAETKASDLAASVAAATREAARGAASFGGDAFHVVCDHRGQTAADVLRDNAHVNTAILTQQGLLRVTPVNPVRVGTDA